MQDDVTEQARDVISGAEIDVRGFGRTHIGRDATDRILAALAAAGLVIERDWQTFDSAPETKHEILAYRPDAGLLVVHFVAPCDMVGGDDDEERWFTVAGEDLTGDLPTLWRPDPASPSPAADHEPEAADPYDATMAAASEYGEPKGPSSR